MPKGDYAQAIGRQSKQLIEAADRYGLPYPRDRRATIDVGKVLRWFHDFLAQNAGLLASARGDDPVLQLASGKLKDDYVRERIQQAQIDNERKRIELANSIGICAPIEPLRQYHNQEAELIRKFRLKLAKRFDGDDREFIENGFEELFDNLDRLAEAKFNTNGHATQTLPASDA